METATTNLKSRTDAVMQRIMEASTEEKFTRGIDEYEIALSLMRSYMKQGKTKVNVFDFQRYTGLGYTNVNNIMRDLIEVGALEKLSSDSDEHMRGDRNILI